VTTNDAQTYAVNPSRLAAPSWGSEKKKRPEGDIYASYSGDTICDSSKVRKPFSWHGSLWVAVNMEGGGGEVSKVKAYRLVPRNFFEGTPTTYRKKTDRDHGEAARKDPKGFYHGMTVTERGEIYVLCGPPSMFVADASAALPPGADLSPAEQLHLF
jgi:hypothetical protein